MSTFSSDSGLDLLGPVQPVRQQTLTSRWLPAVIAAAAIAIAGSGAVAAASMQGGGAKPEDVLPSDALGFVRIDFDPGASQKLALYQLGRRFPALKDRLTGKDNLRDDALRALFAATPEISYDRDVKPWIGDRAGVAVLPSNSPRPDVVAAVQYRNRDAAQAGLAAAEKLAPADTKLTHAFVAGQDYVLIGSDRAVDKAAAARRHLAGEVAFSRAVSRLPGDQLLLNWVDAGRAWAAVPAEARRQLGRFGGIAATLNPSGQLVLGLHAEQDVLELTGRAVGLRLGTPSDQAPTRATSGMIEKLPAQSVVAIAMGGAGEALAAGYDSVQKELAGMAPEFLRTLRGAGVSLPGDLPVLFGTELAATAYGSTDRPQVAVRTRTKDPARAEALATKLLGLLEGKNQPAPAGLIKRTSDGLVIGSDPEAVAAVAADGSLGSSPRFRRVLPSIGGANLIVYVDAAKALELASLQGRAKDNAQPFDAVGLAVIGGPDGSFQLRLAFR